ncbi:protein phosphatase [Plasmopara halstedii]|uniref:Protein phosphatase methylesterase 1 n=1 Tax=Plasmopara halstedii TaxID=4781 RepID=A0A0P1AAT6_PLAHL|nr:protein phosphatase [Plasmopara halstedii]CEG37692.1 protein phosphatase [Plasmopara halstedii]|eukprot:XP_024574061.1 protein phosphatase [Plasmopara halstedii]
MTDLSPNYDDVWARYFDFKEDVELPNGDTFCVYRAGSLGPHVVLLHGGGYTSMTWCLVTALLKENCTLHAFDLRGHGHTQTANDEDLSIETLVQDTLHILQRVISSTGPTTGEAANSKEPQIIIVGHSLGGALAVRVAATGKVPSLVGVMVIDVVEGTAMASLKHMGAILERRPSCFRSHKEAINWALHSGTVRNMEAVEVSIPSQLKQLDDGSLVWKTDLASSAKYWHDWFFGLSKQFLSLKEAKVLILAGSDRLDTELMRGQMMGKFEMRLMYSSGHAIQEDCPHEIANAISDFTGRCARAVSGNIFGPDGVPRQSNEDPVLMERLAKARALIPTVDSCPSVLPAVHPTTNTMKLPPR